ncbi:helix-turn-helix domain-containing protein [Gloeocapsopsis dulcis]|uniref:Fis family transcriptional regulator n=1 Tax=Gloeocapsopsis dulcis AAB1 = 1H9 TaxID=1433147 RepID=A0A6N8G1P1_9CHRO|nr:helix-turn-helix transcriptional regulator [Gloeocapsopsis dulcis]MUL39320.1 Fis family transcriptional regulator [Gloeocapsopsis dulcis AAB1 = 1H9]WNN91566.1 helix-turn-helix transcriptional regulator [Gloeocapsopsis dulcis]
MSRNPHIGSSFDDLLEEEGIIAEVEAIALKRAIAWQVKQAMAEKKLTKTALAKQMKTSRSSIDRLLDPDNPSVTIDTIERAAAVVGKRVRMELVDANERLPQLANH